MLSAASCPFRWACTAAISFFLAVFASSGWAQDNVLQSPASSGASTGVQPAQAPAQSQGNPAQATSSPESQPQAQQPTQGDQNSGDSGMFVFKKQVEEVVLHATVFDEQRRLVTSLEKSAFTVFENGNSELITSFRREDVPVAIGIVVDNSGSMRDKRDEVGKAVLNLIRASNSQDQVFVVNFGRNSYLDQDFTSDVNLLQAALHQVSAKGSTALYDAVVASSLHLERGSPLDKKVLLVITDGEDNMSQETLQEAARRLQQPNGPTVYAIGLLGSGMQKSGREALQQLAAETGGVAYFPDSIDQVDSITRTIAHDIRSQYRIAYKPHNQNEKPEYQGLRVEASFPGYGKLTVRTKSGYYYSGNSAR